MTLFYLIGALGYASSKSCVIPMKTPFTILTIVEATICLKYIVQLAVLTQTSRFDQATDLKFNLLFVIVQLGAYLYAFFFYRGLTDCEVTVYVFIWYMICWMIIALFGCVCCCVVPLLCCVLFAGDRGNLMQIIQNPGNQQAGTAMNIMNQLITREVSPEDMRVNEECVICLKTYTDQDEVIHLPCVKSHFFHDGCIRTWLVDHNNCPLCRTPLSEELIRE
jgi:hypothetical protein